MEFDSAETGARWSDKPILTGKLVTLRPFAHSDAAVMAKIVADPELIKLTGSATSSEPARPTSDEPDERTAQWYGSRAAQTDRLDLAVIDNASGDPVGEVVLNKWDPAANSCNFRTLFAAAAQGRGLGTEATRLIVDYGFQTLGLHRISLDVYAFNPRAQRVYEKVGFRVEGVRWDAFRFDGEYTDEILMAILRSDWRAAQ